MPAVPEIRFLDRTTPPHVLTLVSFAAAGALSMNVFLPSLPAMAAYFDTSYDVMQLSIALYLGVNAVLQLFIGPVSDRYGRRNVVIGAFAIFSAATLGCILAPTTAVFLAFRMLQTVVVTGIVLSRAIVRDMVPEAQAASMIGYVTMGMAVAPMIGPALGGVLDEAFGWQASFGALLVAGLGVIALAWADQGETGRFHQASILAQFRQYPVLIASRRFWGYTLAVAFSSGAFFAMLGGAPLVGTRFYGLSPTAFGLYFGITAVGYMAGNYLTGRYSVRLGLNQMILYGAVLMIAALASAFAMLAAGVAHPLAFFAPLALVSLGNGFTTPNGTAGLLSARPHLAGTASGFSGAIRLGAGAALSALAGSLLGPGGAPGPLLAIMLATAFATLAAMVYIFRIERIESAAQARAAE